MPYESRVSVGSNSGKRRHLGAGDPAAVQTAVSYLAAAFGVASQGTSFELYREGLRHQVRVVVYRSFALLIVELDWRPGLQTPDGRLLTLPRRALAPRPALMGEARSAEQARSIPRECEHVRPDSDAHSE